MLLVLVAVIAAISRDAGQLPGGDGEERPLSSAAERSWAEQARPEEAVIPGLEVSLWERLLSPENLGRALRRVRANAGAPGVDGMTTEELVPWLREHWAQVRQALDAGPVPAVAGPPGSDPPSPGAASGCWGCLPAWTG